MNDPLKTEDGSFTLHSDRYGQTYHSINGALTEAHHVYLGATGVTERLKAGLDTRVLEIGFGLGLNTLLTADVAARHGASLDYHAFEHDLVAPAVISGLGYASLIHQPLLADELLDAVKQVLTHIPVDRDITTEEDTRDQIREPQPLTRSMPSASTPDEIRGNVHSLSPTVQLTLHLQDATGADIPQLCGNGFHAIYLDAFSPDTNSECWSTAFISKLSAVLAKNGCLTTYSARGHVRRAMLAADLSVSKLPGPPGKREMLLGRK